MLILASASPRRAELLRAARIEFDVIRADVDESVLPGETAAQHVKRLAEAKARAVLGRVGDRPVLSADTVVVVDGEILGKPVDAVDGRRMLRLLSGRTHEVMTGVTLAAGRGFPSRQAGRKDPPYDDGMMAEPVTITEIATTTVEFAKLTEAEIDWYIASGEPAGKAGAYAIQGLAARFVARIDGSYSNVVGLPVALVYHLCTQAGLLIS